MKTLKIIESCLANGQHAAAGTILTNVDNAIAADLIQNGRAVIVDTPPDIVVNRDPQIETRDPVKSSKKK